MQNTNAVFVQVNCGILGYKSIDIDVCARMLYRDIINVAVSEVVVLVLFVTNITSVIEMLKLCT